ncbi:MAG: Uncharacterised protein [Prochlorococcus marinus str. MIT 9215]|nr:MAG: Uncharacterised protein [Prochlorococcus marinus str. MIT 9215]
MERATKSIRTRFTDEGLAKTAFPVLGALRLLTPGAAVIMLAGCGAKLPPCSSGLTAVPRQQTQQSAKKPFGKKVLVGIDGSGSMLGYAQANKNVWPRLLQSISQGILLEGLQPITFRIGAGVAEGPLSGSVTQATNPCFFIGCEGYRPVASSLETLWTINREVNLLPLRLLVSDLEVNQSDISSLLARIRPDLDKGASAGILGMKAPFSGNVFGANGKVIQQGNVNRPIFILATGPKEQVRSVLDEVRKTLSLRGITDTRVSIIDPSNSLETKFAKWIGGVPAKAATSGINIRLDGQTFRPAQNPDYQFIRLKTEATGLFVATTKTLSKGAERPDFGIADIERLSTSTGQPQAVEGIQVRSINISGSNVKLKIEIDQSAVSGLYRFVIPAGSMPEEWWVSWDRAEGVKTNVGSKTQGLLLLMTTLSRQIAGAANAPPAAAMCIALQN